MVKLLTLALFATAGVQAASVEIRIDADYAIADRLEEMVATATSPSDDDLSQMKYCIRDAAGATVCTYRVAPSRKKAKLSFVLPAGRYFLAVDGRGGCCGQAPFTVLRCGNAHIAKGEAMELVLPSAAENDIGRFWRDLFSSRRRDMPKVSDKSPRRIFCVGSTSVPRDGDAVPIDVIESAAADMLRAGVNGLVFPEEPGFVGAWRVKFAESGLTLRRGDVREGGRTELDLARQLDADDSCELRLALVPSAAKERSELAAFIRAYRALPGIRFSSVAKRGGVRVRQANWGGRSWFYLVNVGDGAERVSLEIPEYTYDAISGDRIDGFFAGREHEFSLVPGELRVFKSLEGAPLLR